MEMRDVRHLRDLRSDNAQLKRLLAELDLEIDAMSLCSEKTAGRSRSPALGGATSEGLWRYCPALL